MHRRRVSAGVPNNPARRWYELAEQTRFVARMRNGSAQTALLTLANEYEVRARQLEHGFVLTQEVLRGLQGHIRSSWEIDLLRLLLADPGRGWSVAELTAQLRSSERAVTEALSAVRTTGLVDQDADALYRFRPRTHELADLARKFERACAVLPVSMVAAIFSSPPGDDA
jgi:DNA-binding transcriptional ArsR family regulator